MSYPTLINQPLDTRLQARSTNTVFTVPTFSTLESWEKRAEYLRTRLLVSAGLWPMPERTPLHPQITGRIERAEYVIENISLESLPGLFVTGNLYRPPVIHGRLPCVLLPTGHGPRLNEQPDNSVPACGISLARRGCIAFTWDMIGYDESKLQFPHGTGWDHSSDFLDRPDNYLWGISLLGLQLWNSIRVLDFVSGLPEVDTDRIACTGASGAGTQTFLLTAIDERVKASAPVCMVSAHMQGGCQCENAPSLRLKACNVEFAALAAPRPMLIISATGDWTCNTPAIEYPALRMVYKLYGADDRITNAHFDAPHNYNQRSREAMYQWLAGLFLNLPRGEPVREQPYQPEPRQSLLVFPEGRLPAGALTREQMLAERRLAAQAQIAALKPVDTASLNHYCHVMGTAYRYAMNVRLPGTDEIQVETVDRHSGPGFKQECLVIHGASGEHIPAWLFVPETPFGSVLMLHPQGKAALFSGQDPQPLVASLLARGLMVMGIDAWKTGELAAVERDSYAYNFLTYNLSDTALRIQDCLTAISYLRTRTQTVHILGMGLSGMDALLARPLVHNGATTIIDADQFNVENDGAWVEKLYIPLLRRAGDILTAAALTAPGRLVIHNVSSAFPRVWFEDVYRISSASSNLHIQSEPLSQQEILAAIIER